MNSVLNFENSVLGKAACMSSHLSS